MSWSGFSQTDTNSSTIQLTKPVAKLVIKDLIQFDAASKEIETMQLILSETNEKMMVQSDLVKNLKTQVLTYQQMIDNKDGQLEQSKQATKDLEKALKKERRVKKLYQIGSTVGGAAVLLLLVQ